MSLFGNFIGGIGNIGKGIGDIATGNVGQGLGQIGGGLANVGTLGLAGALGKTLMPQMQQYQMSPDQAAFMAAAQNQMTMAGPSQASQQIQSQLLPQALAQNQAMLSSSRSGPAAARNKLLADAQLQQQSQQQSQQSDIMSRLQARAMLGQAYGTSLGINTAQDQAAMQQNLMRQQMFAGLLGGAGQALGSYASMSSRLPQQQATPAAIPQTGPLSGFGNPYQQAGAGFGGNYNLGLQF